MICQSRDVVIFCLYYSTFSDYKNDYKKVATQKG
jgi:hypothetical protein